MLDFFDSLIESGYTPLQVVHRQKTGQEYLKYKRKQYV